MATQRNLNDDILESGSEETFKYLCSPCEKVRKSTKALYYCKDCGEQYCNGCFEFHQRFSALNSHSYLGIEDMDGWGRRTGGSLVLLTEKCDVHAEQIISMFCRHHESLCCHVCVALHHRHCVNMEYIPSIAFQTDMKKEMETIKNQAKITKSKLHNIETEKKKQMRDLTELNEKYLADIKHFRKKINDIFDKLEENAISDLGLMVDERGSVFQADIRSCEKYLNELLDLLKHMDVYQMDKDTPEQMFIRVEKSRKKLADIDKVTKDMDTTLTCFERYEFISNQKIEEFLSGLHTFGKIGTNCVEGEKQDKQSNVSVFKVDKVNIYPMKTKKDKLGCLFYSICQMPNRTLLLTDSGNSTLKIVDENYKVVDRCITPAEPRSVCCISDNKAAVSLANNTIQLVSLREKMSLDKNFGLGHACFGCAFSNNMLYVTDGRSKVHVYTMLGAPLRTFHLDQESKEMLTFAENIAVSHDGSKVYIADFDRGLVTLDSNGNLLSSYNDPELKGACAVCVDSSDHVIVCGLNSHTVLLLDEFGDKKLGVLLTRSSMIDNPRSVCFDKFRQTLLMTNEGHGIQDNLCVFDLK